MPLEWGYGRENGPEKWAQCFPEAAGARQSPVDIRHVDLKKLNANRKLEWRYIPENTKAVINPGYGWKVAVDGDGSQLTGGPLEGRYVLEQFHCHWGESNDEGSEHTINGKKFAGEIHLVHWNATKYKSFAEAVKHPDGLAVLGVFLKPGKKHLELDKIVKQLGYVEFRGQSAKILVPLSPASLIPEDSGYYTYQGSLTTPPCSECVIWIVFKEPVEVSQEQLDAFRRLKCYSQQDQRPCDEFQGFVKANFRPTLPLGQRDIKECRQ
ncbi:carbonic anhydrase isoform X2 [Cylas formicarius]|uniref:carbonic anhydrase isoform X2 n=1 Tax=Cylas formicarius TaxID=197179 RepID=UPI002958AA18|nr:carbonic anhydrase isoform X2 [Cylas formicarius]